MRSRRSIGRWVEPGASMLAPQPLAFGKRITLPLVLLFACGPGSRATLAGQPTPQTIHVDIIRLLSFPELYAGKVITTRGYMVAQPVDLAFVWLCPTETDCDNGTSASIYVNYAEKVLRHWRRFQRVYVEITGRFGYALTGGATLDLLECRLWSDPNHPRLKTGIANVDRSVGPEVSRKLSIRAQAQGPPEKYVWPALVALVANPMRYLHLRIETRGYLENGCVTSTSGYCLYPSREAALNELGEAVPVAAAPGEDGLRGNYVDLAATVDAASPNTKQPFASPIVLTHASLSFWSDPDHPRFKDSFPAH